MADDFSEKILDDFMRDQHHRGGAASPPSKMDHAAQPKTAQEAKELGNMAFKEGEYKVAVRLYGCAIDLDDNESAQQKIYYSNRSASYCILKKYQEAQSDAVKSTELDPSWYKAWYRKGVAEEGLGDYAAAERSFAAGLACAPRDADLLKAHQEVKMMT
mmetsp:Transcript_24013/g.57222  ORF Transcript_24013/g.57222 Transcript_24013/m.57222 type:complete len:159 (-) Transcript_24013:186-662(-)